MSVRLAKLAVALLYAATVVVILKEFSGHGPINNHGPPERPIETIQAGLVAKAAKFILKSKEPSRAVFGGEIRSKTTTFCALLLGLVFVDTSAHEHPTEHKHARARRRGKKSDWKEWVTDHMKQHVACNSPPLDAIQGHRPIVRRLSENLVLTS